MSYAAPPPWIVKRHVMRMARKRRREWSHHGGHRGYPMGSGPFFGGKPKVGRGDVRTAILQLLAEEPMHGYQIIQEITARTDGVWQPSPGSVYPTLQQLEDEGLVQSEHLEGRNVFRLTDEGMAAVDEDVAPPWERMGSRVDDGLLDLRDAAFQVGAAVMQIGRTGTASQTDQAIEILAEARRRLYQILAEDEPTA